MRILITLMDMSAYAAKKLSSMLGMDLKIQMKVNFATVLTKMIIAIFVDVTVLIKRSNWQTTGGSGPIKVLVN